MPLRGCILQLQNEYAVAMTDYEGLGTTDRIHPYLLGQSEGSA